MSVSAVEQFSVSEFNHWMAYLRICNDEQGER